MWTFSLSLSLSLSLLLSFPKCAAQSRKTTNVIDDHAQIAQRFSKTYIVRDNEMVGKCRCWSEYWGMPHFQLPSTRKCRYNLEMRWKLIRLLESYSKCAELGIATATIKSPMLYENMCLDSLGSYWYGDLVAWPRFSKFLGRAKFLGKLNF